MSVLAFARHATESVFRNWRRSLYALIGIILSVSLIAGSWIAVDSAGMGILRAQLEEVQVDFIATHYDDYSFPEVNEEWAASISEDFEQVDDVRGSVAHVSVSSWAYANEDGTEFSMTGEFVQSYSGNLVYLERDCDVMLDALNIEGSLPEPGTVAVPKVVADRLGIGVGDNLTLSQQTDKGYLDPVNYTWVPVIAYWNFSYEISQLWTQHSPNMQIWWNGTYIDKPDEHILDNYVLDSVYLNIDDFSLINWSDPTSSGMSVYISKQFNIWIDRDEVINLGDVSGTAKRLEALQADLQREAYRYGFTVQDSQLIYVLEDVAPSLSEAKLIFFALSIPVIALGTYLSIVGVDLGMNERRREAGILKSRGASNKQVFSNLMIESSLLGVIGGVLGVVVGLLISRFLLEVASSFSYYEDTQSSITDVSVSWTTVLLAIIFSMLLMLASSYRPFKRISKVDVAELIHHYSPVIAQIGYKPRNDFILLGLSILSIVSISLGPEWAFEQDWSWIVVAIVGIAILVGTALFVVMPFMLSLSVVRLVTRGSRQLYAKFTRIVKPWTKELHFLVNRNIVRNPRRASNICVMIALALAFGIFISVTMESMIWYEEERVRFEVGSDVKVYAWRQYGDLAMHPENLSAIDGIEGVESSCVYESVYAQMTSYMDYFYGQIMFLDVHDYADTVEVRDSHVPGGEGALIELDENGTALVLKEWADDYHLEVGDLLNARMTGSHYINGSYIYMEINVPFQVAGFFVGLPGVPYAQMIVERDTISFISGTQLSDIDGYGAGSLINLEDDASPDSVSDEALEIFNEAGYRAESRIMEDELEALDEDQIFAQTKDFFYMEYALSVAIMTVGVGLLVFVSVTDRETELACIMARGSSGSQMRKILMGESFTLMIIGLLVGTIVGLLTAYLFSTLFEAGDPGSPIQRQIVFTWVSFAMLAASIGALVFASLAATIRASRIKLAEVLRIRGG
ncbi:MAG TPA: FtsX-like permease family protein [Thermoplasmata archaeon]